VAFKDTFKILYDFMEKNERVGVVGPKQFNLDNSIQDSCYHWHSLLTPIFRRTFLGSCVFAKKDLNLFLMKDFDKNYIKEVDWLLGSCLFCRTEALDKIGIFDERFFMYFEDTDLCRRFWKNGYKVVYNPEAKIIHNHQRASAKIPWYKILSNPQGRTHIFSWLKYLLKWGPANKKYE
jgi:hypothetical protein